MDQQAFLQVNELKTRFNTERGIVTAVDGVTFSMTEGEVLGIVGESGCGKSVTVQSILRLHDEKNTVKYQGNINFRGKNLLNLSNSKMKKIRGNDISMIFQDPSSSLNPLYKIGNQIAEPLIVHQQLSKREGYQKAIEMLKFTGIPSPEKRVNEYPYQVSGGMIQRVMIAMALVCQPQLLIADEPTTALDVTIQAQILELISSLNKEFNMGILFITHDLGVIAQICSRVVVMYLGQIVEEADTKSIFSNPLHPYTKGLIKSIPQFEERSSQKLYQIKGTVPSLLNIPKGCRFASRCDFTDNLCIEKMPDLKSHNPNHKVRCHNL